MRVVIANDQIVGLAQCELGYALLLIRPVDV